MDQPLRRCRSDWGGRLGGRIGTRPQDRWSHARLAQPRFEQEVGVDHPLDELLDREERRPQA